MTCFCSTLRSATLTLCLLSLIACSSLKPKQTTQSEVTSETNIETESTKPEVRIVDFNQEKDTLYDLLVAEIAAQRNQLGVTLLNYLDQAMATRDPNVIERAVNAAQYIKDSEATVQLAQLWAEVEPENPQPHQILAFQFVSQKNFSDAFTHIEKLLLLGEESRIDSLAISSLQMPKEDRQQLLTLYQELSARHPERFEITYSLAIVLRGLSRLPEAEEKLRQVTAQKTQFEPAWLLLANTLFEERKMDEAEKVAKHSFESFPDNQSIGRVYASVLIEKRKLDKAEEVFEHLIERSPDVTAMQLTLALVKLENNKIAESKKLLLDLRNQGLHQNESNYYLGRIAEKENDKETAIQYFKSVTPGPHFEVAIQHLTGIMIEQKDMAGTELLFAEQRERYPEKSNLLWRIQFDTLYKAEHEQEALAIADAALEAHPEDDQLRYARAMIREKYDDFPGMEADLRHIIGNDPKNAVALNALGYTLADRNERLGEALILIGAALQLEKDNPAIMDSMGWVLYRMGKLQDSLLFLVQSYAKNQDPEIASHLAEVLWHTNQQRQAKVILKRAWMKQPEHPVLKETIERIVPDFYEQIDSINEHGDAEAPEQNRGAEPTDTQQPDSNDASD